jgi:hypothetical protein
MIVRIIRKAALKIAVIFAVSLGLDWGLSRLINFREARKY